MFGTTNPCAVAIATPMLWGPRKLKKTIIRRLHHKIMHWIQSKWCLSMVEYCNIERKITEYHSYLNFKSQDVLS